MEAVNGQARRNVAGVGAGYIKHVIFIVQENRSFDNLFDGFPGAYTRTYGFTSNGNEVPLRPITFSGPDLSHDYGAALVDFNNGALNGFNLPYTTANAPAGTYAYSYVKRSLVAPYWSMARQYVLADHMFPTEIGPSFTAHLDLVAGTTKLTPRTALADIPTNTPWGCDAPPGTLTYVINTSRYATETGPFPCFNNFPTLADLLDNAGLSWKYYAPSITADFGGAIWSIFDSIQSVRNGPDWQNNVSSPQTNVLRDAANNDLPAVAWVIPDWADSDHAEGNNSPNDTGPSWVSAIVNAIGESPAWNSTAIVILWDDWGGWYDDVPPPQVDFVGLGIRVPCIIVSPYAKPHYVSHTQYEFGSLLKFAEQVYDLPSLGATDVRANPLDDAFDFTQPPRAFVPIAAPYPAGYFTRRRPSQKVPDKD